MAEHDFQEGEEVQHKTGKTKMIYIGPSSLGEALCEWVAHDGSQRRDSFSHSALKRYEQPQVGVPLTRRM